MEDMPENPTASDKNPETQEMKVEVSFAASPAPPPLPESEKHEEEEKASKEADAPAPPLPTGKKPFLPFLLLGIFLLTLLPGPLFFYALYIPNQLEEPKTLIFERGTTVRNIALKLYKNNIVIHPIMFLATSHIMANDKLKAGEYEFLPGKNVMDVTRKIRDGKTVGRKFTAAEGLTSAEIVTLLKLQDDLRGDVEAVPPEGSLLPESYMYSLGDERNDVLAHMSKKQKELLNKLWEERDAGLPLRTKEEAVILASIVEKETGPKAEERPIVAGVFYNRLRLHMPLQTDPTIIYAITKGNGPLGRSLKRKDMKIKSPYNTYLHAGLPPGPICNPGRAALEATLHPAKHKYLYFVADGEGGHVFASTLKEHNKNVAAWIKLIRKR